jgi:hypothetical protein
VGWHRIGGMTDVFAAGIERSDLTHLDTRSPLIH